MKLIIFIIATFVLMGTVLATGWNMPVVDSAEPAGFFLGWWHGAILVLSFIRSWWDPSLSLYQTVNNGFWYELGFILGISATFGGGGSSSRR